MKKIQIVFVGVMVGCLAWGQAMAITPEEIGTYIHREGASVLNVSQNTVYVGYDSFVVAISVSATHGDVSYLTYLEDVPTNLMDGGYINKFNTEVKFGRAFIDSDGDIALQMDRNAAGGISLENVGSDFDVFVSLVQKFIADLEDMLGA